MAEAKRKVVQAGLTNVEFRQADIFALPFSAESFDHLFVCFVLEHQDSSRPGTKNAAFPFPQIGPLEEAALGVATIATLGVDTADV